MYIPLCCQRTACPTAFDGPSAVGRGSYSILFVRSNKKILADLESGSGTLEVKLLGECQAFYLSRSHRNNPVKTPLLL